MSSMPVRVFLLLAAWLPATVVAENNPARTEMIFPFFATQGTAGDHLGVTFYILNPGPSKVRVDFQIFESSGREISPINVKANGWSEDSNHVEVEPFRLRITVFQFAEESVVGWVNARSTQPVIIQEFIARTQCPECLLPLARPTPPLVRVKSHILKSPPLPARREIVRVSFLAGRPWTNTGIAIVFAGSAPSTARGTFVLRHDFLPAREKAITLPANRQWVGFLTDLFPDLVHFYPGGTLEMIFDQDVFVTVIQVTVGNECKPFGGEFGTCFEGPVERWSEPISGTALLGIFGR